MCSLIDTTSIYFALLPAKLSSDNCDENLLVFFSNSIDNYRYQESVIASETTAPTVKRMTSSAEDSLYQSVSLSLSGTEANSTYLQSMVQKYCYVFEKYLLFPPDILSFDLPDEGHGISLPPKKCNGFSLMHQLCVMSFVFDVPIYVFNRPQRQLPSLGKWSQYHADLRIPYISAEVLVSFEYIYLFANISFLFLFNLLERD